MSLIYKKMKLWQFIHFMRNYQKDDNDKKEDWVSYI